MKKVKRKIIQIDEEKCDGCGLCIPACPEGVLKIIDDKARLVDEKYCDGLGACLNECPRGAISIIEREVEEFVDEVKPESNQISVTGSPCPSTDVKQWETPKISQSKSMTESENANSELTQWPIQLALVHPQAPFFQNIDLLIAADCVPFAYKNFHSHFLKGKSLVIGCPKLDDISLYREKLVAILKNPGIKSLTVVNMEVPCCFGLFQITEEALSATGKDIPLKQVIINLRGEREVLNYD